jgi:hypothetical protein
VEVTTWRNGKASTRSVELDRVRLDADADGASFKFAPPADAVPLDLATLGVQLP